MSKLKVGLALDMDYLIFSAMSAAEEEQDWGEDVWTLFCDHKKARDILFGTIKTIKVNIAAQLKRKFKLADDKYEFVDICILSGDDNWRKDVLETYKANRKGKRKPVGYRKFCDEIMEHFGEKSFKWHGMEGDDLCGIFMTNPEIVGCDRVISVSCDKDFNTVPGYFFWLTEQELIKNDETTADLHHFYQTLKGDTTDGYGGVPGVGEAFGPGLWEWLQDPEFFYEDTKVMKSGKRKGEEVSFWTSCKPGDEEWDLRQAPTLWACMASLAAKQGMSEEDLIVQAQVARICRGSDFDLETKKPILWKPKAYETGRV
ncbi:RNaseH [Pseudomonas phage vB_PpuP-Kallioja]